MTERINVRISVAGTGSSCRVVRVLKGPNVLWGREGSFGGGHDIKELPDGEGGDSLACVVMAMDGYRLTKIVDSN
ncbi:hypothetical protein IF1G_09098 [Cordyceps javanica]|uniref:Uncharacterized protein n=1 Tax=Cordyceps javanica TaxID=43265 RepID=A0A545URE0_9HYPO|nr:hypothetical protein IF1G_09098 [Cordyceps javanica]